MVKLKDAKCPNCGANIQVNDKLENTICQYCGSQVVIEEAIEKYKLEISGKVEVDGIKGRNTKLEQAKKHMKIEEYDIAKGILQEIIREDSLDVEAYIELVKVDIELLKKSNFNENSSNLTNYAGWNLYDEILSCYDRIKKISEKDNIDEEFGKYNNDLQHYFELKKRIEEEEKELAEYTAKLNKFYEETGRIAPECQESWLKNIVGKYFEISKSTTEYCQHPVNGTYYNDTYRMTRFNRITRDGILAGRYLKSTRTYTNNPLHAELYSTFATTMTMEQIRNNIKEIEGVTPEYIRISREKTNKVINKNNKKLNREATILNAKGKLIQIRMYIDYAIIAILVILTITAIFTDGFGTALALGIFLDSWLIYWLVERIQDHKMDLSINDSDKRINKGSKRDNV